jgi:hypothetical protein
MERVDAFYRQLMPLLARHKWAPGSADPGPIIATQIENEYGAFVYLSSEGQDVDYLDGLLSMTTEYGLDGVYIFMSDAPLSIGIIGTYDDCTLCTSS